MSILKFKSHNKQWEERKTYLPEPSEKAPLPESLDTDPSLESLKQDLSLLEILKEFQSIIRSEKSIAEDLTKELKEMQEQCIQSANSFDKIADRLSNMKWK